MANPPPAIRIGIYGNDCSFSNERHGCGLWPAGLAASVTAAEAVPIVLEEPAGRPWASLLEGIQGVVIAGHDGAPRKHTADGEALCLWCRKQGLPLLAIDHGLHLLNTTYGGTVHFDLPRDLPEALQHRHPPERGLRHAINIVPKSILAELYGEGEVVVNSEHRRAIQRLARLPGLGQCPRRRHRGRRVGLGLVRPRRPVATGLGDGIRPGHPALPRPDRRLPQTRRGHGAGGLRSSIARVIEPQRHRDAEKTIQGGEQMVGLFVSLGLFLCLLRVSVSLWFNCKRAAVKRLPAPARALRFPWCRAAGW